jgi:acyl carrier protein
MRDIHAELQEIFRDLFDDDTIHITDRTTAADIKGWDSLRNVKLMVRIERGFAVRFRAEEIVALKNVGDLIKLIEARLAREKDPAALPPASALAEAPDSFRSPANSRKM